MWSCRLFHKFQRASSWYSIRADTGWSSVAYMEEILKPCGIWEPQNWIHLRPLFRRKIHLAEHQIPQLIKKQNPIPKNTSHQHSKPSITLTKHSKITETTITKDVSIWWAGRLQGRRHYQQFWWRQRLSPSIFGTRFCLQTVCWPRHILQNRIRFSFFPWDNGLYPVGRKYSRSTMPPKLPATLATLVPSKPM